MQKKPVTVVLELWSTPTKAGLQELVFTLNVDFSQGHIVCHHLNFGDLRLFLFIGTVKSVMCPEASGM